MGIIRRFVASAVSFGLLVTSVPPECLAHNFGESKVVETRGVPQLVSFAGPGDLMAGLVQQHALFGFDAPLSYEQLASVTAALPGVLGTQVDRSIGARLNPAARRRAIVGAQYNRTTQTLDLVNRGGVVTHRIGLGAQALQGNAMLTHAAVQGLVRGMRSLDDVAAADRPAAVLGALERIYDAAVQAHQDAVTSAAAAGAATEGSRASGLSRASGRRAAADRNGHVAPPWATTFDNATMRKRFLVLFGLHSAGLLAMTSPMNGYIEGVAGPTGHALVNSLTPWFALGFVGLSMLATKNPLRTYKGVQLARFAAPAFLIGLLCTVFPTHVLTPPTLATNLQWTFALLYSVNYGMFRIATAVQDALASGLSKDRTEKESFGALSQGVSLVLSRLFVPQMTAWIVGFSQRVLPASSNHLAWVFPMMGQPLAALIALTMLLTGYFRLPPTNAQPKQAAAAQATAAQKRVDWVSIALAFSILLALLITYLPVFEQSIAPLYAAHWSPDKSQRGILSLGNYAIYALNGGFGLATVINLRENRLVRAWVDGTQANPTTTEKRGAVAQFISGLGNWFVHLIDVGIGRLYLNRFMARTQAATAHVEDAQSKAEQKQAQIMNRSSLLWSFASVLAVLSFTTVLLPPIFFMPAMFFFGLVSGLGITKIKWLMLDAAPSHLITRLSSALLVTWTALTIPVMSGLAGLEKAHPPTTSAIALHWIAGPAAVLSAGVLLMTLVLRARLLSRARPPQAARPS